MYNTIQSIEPIGIPHWNKSLATYAGCNLTDLVVRHGDCQWTMAQIIADHWITGLSGPQLIGILLSTTINNKHTHRACILFFSM